MDRSRGNPNYPPRRPDRPHDGSGWPPSGQRPPSGPRPPRSVPPPQATRDEPDDGWSEEQETLRTRRPRPQPPAWPTRHDERDDDQDDGDDVNDNEAQISQRPRPASRRTPPEGRNPLDDPRAPTVLRRAPRSDPSREPPLREPRRSGPSRPPGPSRERWGRSGGYDQQGYDQQGYDDTDYGERAYGEEDDGASGYHESGYHESGYQDEPNRGGQSRDPRGPMPSRHYADDPRARGGPREGGARADAYPSSRGRPRDYDERGYDARGYDDWRGAQAYQGYQSYPGAYGERQRRPPPPDRGRRRQQWDELRDTAGQWLSASLPVPGTRGRRFPVVLVLVLVLLAGVAAAGLLLGPKVLSHLSGSSPTYAEPPGTYTPGPTPPAQSGFKKFVSTRSNYSIDYPQGWTVANEQQTAQGQPDAIDIFTPSTLGTLDSMVVEQPASADGSADPDVITSEVAAAQQGGVTFTPTSSIAIQVNIGGEYWQRRDYTVNGNGQTSHEAIFAGHHEGRAYVIVLAGGADTFAGDYASYFRPALSSFRFNS